MSNSGRLVARNCDETIIQVLYPGDDRYDEIKKMIHHQTITRKKYINKLKFKRV